MNKHVTPLEPKDQPHHGEIAREEAFLDILRTQINAIKPLLVGVGVE
jgi:hypothetical protein